MAQLTPLRPIRAPRSLSAHPRFFSLFATVMVIQGIHVFEHALQLLQVYVFDIPSERAFGLLGFVINFNDTAEWLHLGFNLLYLVSLYVLAVALHELVLGGAVSNRAFWTFLVLGVGLETWHMVEHVVIISNVVRNNGCPCPGIADRALNVTDIQLHFVYNTLTYGATAVPFVAVWRSRLATREPAIDRTEAG
jgi:hypothetical protein